jgi:hypothetical protein
MRIAIADRNHVRTWLEGRNREVLDTTKMASDPVLGTGLENEGPPRNGAYERARQLHLNAFARDGEEKGVPERQGRGQSDGMS